MKKKFDKPEFPFKLSLPALWHVDISTVVVISCFSTDHVLPKFEIFTDESLKFFIRVYGWMLPDDHEVYTLFDHSFLNVTLSDLIKMIQKHHLCNGISTPDPLKVLNIRKHVIPKKFNFVIFQQSQYKLCLHQDEFYRSNTCDILVPENSSCKDCKLCLQKFKNEINRKNVKLNQPAKLNAPIKFTSPERVKLTLQDHRLKCKQLEQELVNMRTALENESESVSSELGEDLNTLFSGCDKKDVPNFMKLFWEEQQKYIKSSSASSVRYHPMIIRFCLNLAAKSTSSYNDLRYDSKTGTGFLVLPSLRTLRDYKNYIHPTRGFNSAIIKDLAEKTVNFSGPERFVTILFDEMKIQEDLIWDKYSGELIGFVDLGDINTNYATLKNVKELATHVLVFLVKSIVNPLSFSIATFATTGISSCWTQHTLR